MSVTYSDFRNSVQELFDSKDEMDRRNAISRSYYAAYHHALLIEIECKIKDHRRIKGKATHVQLATKFQYIMGQSHLTEGVMEKIKSLGFMLNDGRLKRQIADYNLDVGITDQQIKDHQRNMDKFHDLADQVMDACKS